MRPRLPWSLKLLLNKTFLLLVVLAFVTSTAPTLVAADASRDANRIIRLTNISEQFESARRQQTRDIIRTYAIIVSTNSDHELPASVKREISSCYERVYHWANFEQGIVDILLDNFSEKELGLLVDFYKNRSLPPTEIGAFKDIVAKGALIQHLGADYIFSMSDGCVEEGKDAVMAYLTKQN